MIAYCSYEVNKEFNLLPTPPPTHIHTHTHSYSDQWPPGRPIPEYHIEFTDGCIPSNLHNASDCPANFPTLDTLPREQRGPSYSDAYDGDLADGETSGLLINPAVMQAVASKAAMVSTPILPGSASRRPVSNFKCTLTFQMIISITLLLHNK